VRIGTVTHCTNMGQLFIPISKAGIQQTGSKVNLQVPTDSNIAPPGHYMLFLFNDAGVPAIAPIIQLKPSGETKKLNVKPSKMAAQTPIEEHVKFDARAVSDQIITNQVRPAIAVGLTPTCPYGLGPCWGGAFEGLKYISDIDVVRPLPNHADSVAYVYLKEDILPDIDVWRSEFRDITGGSYFMRGIEITLSGVLRKGSGADAHLTLASTTTRPELVLKPFQAGSKIEWDSAAQAPQSTSDAEASAYARLSTAAAQHPGVSIQVTGPLQKLGGGQFSLEVRAFEVATSAS